MMICVAGNNVLKKAMWEGRRVAESNAMSSSPQSCYALYVCAKKLGVFV